MMKNISPNGGLSNKIVDVKFAKQVFRVSAVNNITRQKILLLVQKLEGINL